MALLIWDAVSESDGGWLIMEHGKNHFVEQCLSWFVVKFDW